MKWIPSPKLFIVSFVGVLIVALIAMLTGFSKSGRVEALTISQIIENTIRYPPRLLAILVPLAYGFTVFFENMMSDD